MVIKPVTCDILVQVVPIHFCDVSCPAIVARCRCPLRQETVAVSPDNIYAQVVSMLHRSKAYSFNNADTELCAGKVMSLHGYVRVPVDTDVRGISPAISPSTSPVV